MKQTNIPEIRFDGFYGEWDSKPFGEIVERKSAVTRVTGGLNLEFEDIVSGAGVLNKDLASKPNNKQGVPFSVGDVLFGKLRPYLRNWLRPDFDGVAVGDFWVLRPVEADSAFVYSTIQRSAFMRVANMSSGTKMPRSDWGLVSETIFGCPSSSEQADVGTFFSHLDTVLDAGEKKLEKLRALKQTMLTKMFPQGDSRVPEIRFEGFEGEWEAVRIGDHGHAVSGVGFPERHQGGQVGVPFFKVSDMNSPGNECHMSSAMNYVTEEQITEMRWPVIQQRSVFFAKVGAAVMKNRKRMVEPPFLMDNNTMAYLFNDAYWDSNFVLRRFEQIDLTKLVQVGALPSYNSSQVEDIETFVPTKLEQQAIGAYFREFDVLLDAESQKLEKLRHLKAAFLRSMFV